MSNAAQRHTADRAKIPTGEPSEPLKLGAKLIGLSGRQYQIAQILQHRTEPLLSCVYLATYAFHPSRKALSLSGL
jgi:hypothetical protein